jgi:hypothetical protein
MSFSWQYPIYLLPHDQGYASLIDSNEDEPIQLLIVCTAAQSAVELMEQLSPKPTEDGLVAHFALDSDLFLEKHPAPPGRS